MSENLDQKVTAEAWADFTIQAWRKELRRLKIGMGKRGTNKLNSSLERKVSGLSNGEITNILFLHWYWGTFVDMGVGNGVSLGDVAEMSLNRRLLGKQTGNRRKPKKWKGRILYSRILALEELMLEKYGLKVKHSVFENMRDTEVKIAF